MPKTYSCILVGLEVIEVEIETIVGLGFSGLNILGLKSDITRDMRERVRSALEFIGIPIPAKRVVVNISSQENIKLSRTPLQELDFAVATSIILALFEDQGIKFPKMEKEFFGGELSLTGQLKPVQNKLLYEKIAVASSDETIPHISLNLSASQGQDSFEIYTSLSDWLNERKHNTHQIKKKVCSNKNLEIQNIPEHKIQCVIENIQILLKNPKACVSMLIAAAGNHHVLLAGEPGIGKSFSVHKMKNIVAPPSRQEQIEIKLIHANRYEIFERPFRSPHHSSTVAALIGGQSLKPGEVTLAHHGILFLDEIAEFSHDTLEALREPLDSGKIELSKAIGSITYPAQFLLCATTNPCRCGYFLSHIKSCRCMPNENRKYLAKISGPLLDRFCLQVWMGNSKQSNESDIFSNYLLELDHEKLYFFAKNFLQIQIQIRNDNKTLSFEQIPEIDQNECFSLRSKNKIYRLANTFKMLFPDLSNQTHFIAEILKYRNFSSMIDKNLVY